MSVIMWCPSCAKAWPAGQVACRACLVELVADPGGTVRCRHCDRDWPARMQSCPNCLAELRPDPAAAAEAMSDILAAGGHLFRPDGVAPFASGPDCTLARLSPRGGLVLTDAAGLVEASVVGADIAAAPPLACHDLDGSTLFRLEPYEAAPRALVAIGGDGAPIATYLRNGRRIDVRDETSAPVARFAPVAGGDWSLAETGGGVLASCWVADEDHDGWVDDQWSLRQVADRMPLKVLGAVGLVLAAKVMVGRAQPVRAGADREDDDDPDGEPRWNEWNW